MTIFAIDMEENEKYMREALREAGYAAAEDEVPVGAVIVCHSRIIGKGHNMTEKLNDPTAHAEMIAITAATEAMGGKYLNDCTLYVTVEPCPMCAGAIRAAQIEEVYFGAYNLSDGAAGTVYNLLHPYVKVFGGIKKSDCESLIKDFFAQVRNNK